MHKNVRRKERRCRDWEVQLCWVIFLKLWKPDRKLSKIVIALVNLLSSLSKALKWKPNKMKKVKIYQQANKLDKINTIWKKIRLVQNYSKPALM